MRPISTYLLLLLLLLLLNILTDIVSKVMADVPSARNAKLFSQLSEDETEMPSFDLLGSIFPEPPAKRFANLSENELEELVSERHPKKTKEVTNSCVSTFNKTQCLMLPVLLLSDQQWTLKGLLRKGINFFRPKALYPFTRKRSLCFGYRWCR